MSHSLAQDLVLATIARAFAAADIRWGLGGSRMLLAYGLVEQANDLDLLVHVEDADRAMSVLATLGTGGPGERKALYATEVFGQFRVAEVAVDLLAGYRIRFEGGVYAQPFDARSVTDIVSVADVDVPLTALEDWFVSYQFLPGKDEKLSAIESFFAKNGVGHPHLLQRALQQDMPAEVRARVERVLGIEPPARRNEV